MRRNVTAVNKTLFYPSIPRIVPDTYIYSKITIPTWFLAY